MSVVLLRSLQTAFSSCAGLSTILLGRGIACSNRVTYYISFSPLTTNDASEASVLVKVRPATPDNATNVNRFPTDFEPVEKASSH